MRQRTYAAAAALTMMIAGLLLGDPAAPPAYACSCAELTEQEDAEVADLIIEGVVTDVRRPIVRLSTGAPVGG